MHPSIQASLKCEIIEAVLHVNIVYYEDRFEKSLINFTQL